MIWYKKVWYIKWIALDNSLKKIKLRKLKMITLPVLSPGKRENKLQFLFSHFFVIPHKVLWIPRDRKGKFFQSPYFPSSGSNYTCFCCSIIISVKRNNDNNNHHHIKNENERYRILYKLYVFGFFFSHWNFPKSFV